MKFYKALFLLLVAFMLVLLLAPAPTVAADMPVKAQQQTGGTVYVPGKWDGKYIGAYAGVEAGKSTTGVDGWTDKNYVNDCKKVWKPIEIAKGFSWNEGNEYECKPKKYHPSYTTTTYPGVTANKGNVIGIALGMYVGINKQVNQIVLSAELEGGYSGASDNEVIYAITSEHKTPWNARLRGRIGFLPTKEQDTMLYLALGGVVKEQRSTITSPSETATENKVKAGLTAGVGVEHKWGALTGRVEGGYDRVSDQMVCITGACTTLKGGSIFGRAGLGVSF